MFADIVHAAINLQLQLFCFISSVEQLKIVDLLDLEKVWGLAFQLLGLLAHNKTTGISQFS